MPDKLVPGPKLRPYPPVSDLWQIPAIAAAIALFAVAVWVAKHPAQKPSTQAADFAALVQAYESGNTIVAGGSAERFLARYGVVPKRDLGVACFILADSKWDLTRANPATTDKDLLDCQRAYDRAIALGIEPKYKGKALAAQGDIYARLGQVTEALDAYTELLDEFPDRRETLLSMALAHARTKPPLKDKALECVDKYLASEGLTPQEIQEGYLTKAEVLLLGTDKDRDCAGAATAARRVIDAGAEGETAGRAALLEARALMGQEKYDEALATIGAANLQSTGRYEASLVLARAVSLWKSGKSDEGRKALDETVFRFPGTMEALSARYELAQLFFEQGGLDAAKDALVSLLDDMSAHQAIATDYFTIDDVTSLWYAVGRAILAQGGYKAVQSFHSAASALMPQGRFLFFDAVLYLREAELQEADLPSLPASQAAAAEKAIRATYREAGDAFAKVLETPAGSLYQEALYNAGHALYMAGDYARALHYLRMFSDGNYHDDRLPKVLYEQGSCLAAMGNATPAIIVSGRNATEHPTNLYAYKSILLQADLYRDMGGKNLDYAAVMYNDILTDGRFGSKSVEWRRSIFSLGETLYELGRYKEAVLKLEEAITRFSEDAETANATYYLAMACRKAALTDPAMKQAFFTRAAKLFAGIAASGAGKEDARARSAAFLEADCYYDLGDYRKALGLYDKAVEANVDTPEATRALFQIANCYHRLGMKEQADATYKRATFNLKHRQAPPAPGEQFYESLASWLGSEEKQG